MHAFFLTPNVGLDALSRHSLIREPDPRKEESMRLRLLAIPIVAAAAFCMFSSLAMAANDPRKCGSTGGRIAAGRVDGPTFCAYQAAQLAARRYITAINHASVVYSGPMKCLQGATNLTWTCAFTAGKTTVLFRAFSNGWHTRVTMTG